ncbi:hypothetical protein [Bradyrhizobium sp. BR 10261]|uniref:hypothetical protein n=1 Tax=Bradyrhizobium sp. BR 10261 TaxID=2749992 RepID=UPI001C6481AC|nr:hypothetical protein [Bradyrhizobium sp. BR 10261]MBW7961374.1 hypothetical protein [Bradyrhizobium sp. BR 10261]
MKITLFGPLILIGMAAAAAPPILSFAQSNAPAASAASTPNTNMTPAKHRYWRHRGGKHPHFGSRRVRSQVQAPQ